MASGAHELVGQCGHKAFLRLESQACAEWASQVVGEFERYEYLRSWSSGNNGGSSTVNEHLVRRAAVLPSQFMSLPPTSRASGLSGYYLSPGIGAFSSLLKGKALAKQLRPRDPSVPDFVPRPVEYQYLEPWTNQDLARLGLDEEAEPAGEEVKPHPAASESGASKPRLQVVREKGSG